MRRKGTPCACECDPCKGKNNIRTINNASPDPNGDFILEAGNGIGITEVQYGLRIDNLTDPDSLIAGTNIVLTQIGGQLEIAVSEDINIGNLNVAGDIIQQGSAYETHAEQIYTTDDYIIMRDNAVGGLASGSYSGFQVKLYDGTNDGRLVIDNTGTARVGDVGDEQPLLKRDESADLTNGESLVWDSANSKAVTQAIPSAISTALSGKENSIIYRTAPLTPRNDLSGITISNIDGQAGIVTRYGKLIIANLNVSVSGTRTGLTGWYDLYSSFLPSGILDPGESMSAPYMIAINGTMILNGDQMYFTNGQSYSAYIIGQVICRVN